MAAVAGKLSREASCEIRPYAKMKKTQMPKGGQEEVQSQAGEQGQGKGQNGNWDSNGAVHTHPWTGGVRLF